MARKRQLKRFSGSTTADRAALEQSLDDAVGVRVTRGGFLVYAVDPDANVLAPETEKYVSILSDEAIAETHQDADLSVLRDALAVSEIPGSICMCPGDLALEFLDRGGATVEVVRFDYPDSIEWRGWAGKARLAEPDQLIAWLEAHGVTSP